jgi:hypothetical protein
VSDTKLGDAQGSMVIHYDMDNFCILHHKETNNNKTNRHHASHREDDYNTAVASDWVMSLAPTVVGTESRG